MTILRTFIAIPLPADFRAYLSRCIEEVVGSNQESAIRIVSSENIHLTLRFLGETAETKLPLMEKTLDSVAENFSTFNLHLNSFGAFPNQHHPRVIWAGFDGEVDILFAIQKQIEIGVQALGWKPEKRPFKPHVTLARVKKPVRAEPLNWTDNFSPKKFQARSIELIQSDLKPDGPKYSSLHSSFLQ